MTLSYVTISLLKTIRIEFQWSIMLVCHTRILTIICRLKNVSKKCFNFNLIIYQLWIILRLFIINMEINRKLKKFLKNYNTVTLKIMKHSSIMGNVLWHLKSIKKQLNNLKKPKAYKKQKTIFIFLMIWQLLLKNWVTFKMPFDMPILQISLVTIDHLCF